MKKRVLATALALGLALSLTLPAGAYQVPTEKYASIWDYVAFYRAQEDEDSQKLADYMERRLTRQSDLAEGFAAEAYYMFWGGSGVSKRKLFEDNGPDYTEDHFRSEMLNRYLTEAYVEVRSVQLAETREQTEYPERFAAFDAEAWFRGAHADEGLTALEYRQANGSNEDQFRWEMFNEYATRSRGYYNGYCVMAQGEPVRFDHYHDLNGYSVVPYIRDDRILVPARAVCETLGLTVDYWSETRQVICSGELGTVIFTLDSQQYSGGWLDVAPFAWEGITYLPVRALAEALGYTVTWDQEFSTAMIDLP